MNLLCAPVAKMAHKTVSDAPLSTRGITEDMAMYPEWFGELAIGMAQTAKRKHRDRDGEARVINAFRSVFRRVRGL